jgi:hypothetical protein
MQNFDEIGGFLRIDPETFNDLDRSLLERHVALTCWRFRVSPMLSILLGMQEEDNIFILAILQISL